jgi:hypothetical protein
VDVGELAIRDLDFEATARVGAASELTLTGSADNAVATQLTTLIDNLHNELVATGSREICVDIRALEFMNASCFNILVNWLGHVNELDPDKRYQLKFSTNTSIPWQRRSLRTLSCFATDLVTVEG